MNSVLRCGPLKENVVSKLGQLSLPETLQLQILSLILRTSGNSFVEKICCDSFVNLLKWNNSLLESFVKYSYEGWIPKEKIEIPSRWTDDQLLTKSKLWHLQAIANNVNSHPLKWVKIRFADVHMIVYTNSLEIWIDTRKNNEDRTL